MAREFEPNFEDLRKFSTGRQYTPEGYMSPEDLRYHNLVKENREQRERIRQFCDGQVYPVINAFSDAVGGFLEAGPTIILPLQQRQPFLNRLGRLSWPSPTWNPDNSAQPDRDLSHARLNFFHQFEANKIPIIRMVGFSDRFTSRFQEHSEDILVRFGSLDNWSVQFLNSVGEYAGSTVDRHISLVANLENPGIKGISTMLRTFYTELG